MEFIAHTTTSKDGTVIGYRKLGSGPGLVICHGAGRISQNYEKLALALSGKFTVYVPDRRGRGLSGPEGEGYDMRKATEDLIAVIQASSADYVFGHSSGGLIALETVLIQPLKKLAVYEPPVSVNRSFPLGWLPDFEHALQKGQRKRAMAISLKGLNAVDGMAKMPFLLVMLLVQLLSFLERKKDKEARMLSLLPTLAADVKMARALDSKFAKYLEISIPVSLMKGSKSPRYFHTGLKALSDTIQQSDIRIFEGFDHYSPEEKVTEIAEHLTGFYFGNS